MSTAAAVAHGLSPADFGLREDDVVQLSNRDCAITAAVLAVMHTNPGIIASIIDDAPYPPGRADVRGAPWWRALAAHMGSPQTRGFCHQYLERLTGCKAVAQYYDIKNGAFLLWLLAHRESKVAMPLEAADQHALRQFVDGSLALKHRVRQLFDWRSPASAAKVDDILRTEGMSGSFAQLRLRAAVVTAIDALLGAARRPSDTPTSAELFLADTIEHKLAARKPVCLSTRPWLLGVPRWLDVALGVRNWRYAVQVLLCRARHGLFAEHAYAVTGIRRRQGGIEVQLRDPAVTGADRIHWIELRLLARATIGLYCVE